MAGHSKCHKGQQEGTKIVQEGIIHRRNQLNSYKTYPQTLGCILCVIFFDAFYLWSWLVNFQKRLSYPSLLYVIIYPFVWWTFCDLKFHISIKFNLQFAHQFKFALLSSVQMHNLYFNNSLQMHNILTANLPFLPFLPFLPLTLVNSATLLAPSCYGVPAPPLRTAPAAHPHGRSPLELEFSVTVKVKWQNLIEQLLKNWIEELHVTIFLYMFIMFYHFLLIIL